MFGYHEIPLHIEQDGIILSVEREGENLRYKRACLEEEVEKTLLAGSGRILLNPVEPLNKPKVLTRYLLIEFNNALLVEPKGKKTIFLTFPIEIAVYISSKKQFEVIDILSLPRQKFALYGDPRNGLICKYWRSAVSPTMLSLDPLYEGLMELTVANMNPNWVEVTKGVFNAYGMKLYYRDTMVSMKASMTLRGGHIAQTDFINAPLQEGMTKSLEVYTAKKLSIATSGFVMEYGL